MTNVIHAPTAPGLALTGDAAGALDPLWGVGCGFAFQSAEWLADSVAPALLGAESLEQGLERYRRRHARGLRGHTATILDYSSGRKLNPGERMLFSAATYDERTARVFEAFGSRNIGPVRMLATGVPLCRRGERAPCAARGEAADAPATPDLRAHSERAAGVRRGEQEGYDAAQQEDYDVAIVGASLAGCATAIFLAGPVRA